MEISEPRAARRLASARISVAEEVLVWHLHGDGISLGAETGGRLRHLFADLDQGPRSLAELLARLARPEDRPKLARMIDAVASDRQPRRCLHRLRTQEGGRLNLETRVIAEPERGRPVGTTRDVDRELQLEREHRELSAVSDALSLTVLIFNRRGRLVHRVGSQAFAGDGQPWPTWFGPQLRAALRGGLFQGGGELREGRTGAVRSFEVRFVRRGAPPGGITAIVADVSDRVSVVADLAAHQSDLYTLLDTVADAIAVEAPDGRVLFINRSARASLGLPATGSVLATDAQAAFLAQLDIFDEAGRPVRREEMPGPRALQGLPQPERLMRSRRKGQRDFRWTLVRAVPIFGDDGRVRMAISTWTDVTEIQRAREELKRQQAILGAETEASPDAILAVSNGGQVLDYNSRFVELWGLKRPITTTSDHELLQAVRGKVAEPEAFLQRVAEIYADSHSTSHEELRLRDGRHLERYSAPAISDGKTVGRVWFFRDVTDRRRAEQRERLLIEERSAHAASERVLRRWEFLAQFSRGLAGHLELETIVAHVARVCVPRLGVVCVIDCVVDGGRIHRRAVQLPAGRRPADFPGLTRSEVDLSAPRGVAAVLREGAVRREEVEPFDSGWSPLGEPGERAGLELRALGVKELVCLPLLAGGMPFGVLSFGRAEHIDGELADLFLLEEVAQRLALALEGARLYQRAQDAIAGRDDFLSVASHELRTPLTALRLVHQSMARVLDRLDPGVAPVMRKLVATADAQDHRLGKLIDSLLDVTRIQGRKLQLELQDVDLAEVARTTAAMFRDELARSRQQLTVDAPYPVVGHWDRARLEQVATNLLSNAIKYGEGKPIELAVRRLKDRARLTVRDHGIGIAPDRQARVFERFERAVSSRHYGGLGLGLYIVHGIVESLGGTVRVESAPGKGSTFMVELPLRAEVRP